MGMANGEVVGSGLRCYCSQIEKGNLWGHLISQYILSRWKGLRKRTLTLGGGSK